MIKFSPKRLSKHHIFEIVEEFRKEHKYARKFPVDVESLIEFELKIEVVPVKNLSSAYDIEAFISRNLQKIFIDDRGYTNSTYVPRQRFTLAEEVGHYVLHKDIYLEGAKYTSENEFVEDITKMDPDDLDWIEYQARQFAGRLLVPYDELETRVIKGKPLIKEFHERYDGHDDVKEFVIEGFSKKICNEFEVSYEVIKFRIYHEGLEHHFENK